MHLDPKGKLLEKHDFLVLKKDEGKKYTYRANQTDASDWESLHRNEVCLHALEEVSVLARKLVEAAIS